MQTKAPQSALSSRTFAKFGLNSFQEDSLLVAEGNLDAQFLEMGFTERHRLDSVGGDILSFEVARYFASHLGPYGRFGLGFHTTMPDINHELTLSMNTGKHTSDSEISFSLGVVQGISVSRSALRTGLTLAKRVGIWFLGADIAMVSRINDRVASERSILLIGPSIRKRSPHNDIELSVRWSAQFTDAPHSVSAIPNILVAYRIWL